MTNKEFDHWLRNALTDMHQDKTPDDWDAFVRQVEDAEGAADADFDSAVRGAMGAAGADMTPDWSRMESMLDNEELHFDDQVRNSMENMQVPYNPGTWPALDAKISQEEKTRRRLIGAKILELVAVLIVLFTFYNFFPALKERMNPSEDVPVATSGSMAALSATQEADLHIAAQDVADASGADQIIGYQQNERPTDDASVKTSDAATASHTIPGKTASLVAVKKATSTGDDVVTSARNSRQSSFLPSRINLVASGQERLNIPAVSTPAQRPVNATHLLSPLRVGLVGSSFLGLTTASVTPKISTKRPDRLRFGMMAALDVNTLFFPDDLLFYQGQAVRFSEQEIEAGGYTAGATLLFDRPHFIVETGLLYSSKNFGPNRKLFIGSTPDQHELDFENITLNVISVPLNLHVKLDGKGLWRFYAVAGAQLNIIADAHYDVVVENTTPQSAPSRGPFDPVQLETQREIQRVREHMLDGAKFNSKAYLTASGGVGVERFLNTNTSVFLQPMYHYQLSFFGLIDQNGKLLRSTSLTFGTRISL